ncbi:MAG: 16S rRNA (cytidine(1402)-2'-O)-methyltransferase [Bdellovibrionia bacterium]
MLYVVATPIGDMSEISLRALDVLKDAEIVICEGTKETSKLLRHHGITGKRFEILDEHSKPEDLKNLLSLCQNHICALVTDCGTPSFSDPGADLVGLCRQQQVEVKSVLGPSSLMGLLSLSGKKLTQFVFRGFLSANTEERKRDLNELKKEKRAVVLMDTPYRLKKTLQDMQETFPRRQFLLVMNLSQNDELCLEGSIETLIKKNPFEKAEFMLLIYPE